MTYVCLTCGFDLWLPICDLRVSTLAFYNDARFPGRCILALKEHYDHLHEVPDQIAMEYMLDVRDAGKAIQEVTELERLNYAVLGNVVPHVHTHIIPRGAVGDVNPGRPPWEDAAPHTKISQYAEKVYMIDILEKLSKLNWMST